MEEYLEKVSRPDDLAVAIQAAEAAGEIMNRYQRGQEELGTEAKSHHNDVVTEADLEAQERIVEIISEEFPDDGFTGEEELEKESYSRRNWIIDPIDGTSNFERGIPYFCTSIGLEVDGELVLGVVYSPETGIDEIFFGCNNSGAYRISDGEIQEIGVSDRKDLESAMVLGSLNERDSEDRKRDFQLAEKVMDRGAKFRRMGSAVLNHCLVASGNSDAVLYRKIYEWDYAASKVIVDEAGGETDIRDTGGETFSSLASNPNLHDELERIFRSYRP
ncbi:MAG: inositol monophosphatase [Candidatus Nanosalina sp.]